MPYDNATWLANNDKELKSLFNGNVYSGDATSPWKSTPAAAAADPYKMYSAPGVEYDPGNGFDMSKATNMVYGPAMQARQTGTLGQMGPTGGGFGTLAQATFGNDTVGNVNFGTSSVGGNTNGGGSSVDWNAVKDATSAAKPNPLIDTLKNYDWSNGSGSYLDPSSNTLYSPLRGPATRGEGQDNWIDGPITGYYKYANGQSKLGAAQYNGANYDTLDMALNKTGGGQFSGLGDKTMDFIENIMPLLLTGAGVGAAGGLAGLFGSGGAAATDLSAMASGLEPGLAGATTGSVGSTLAEQIAMMQANGMTAAEIAAATGGASGYTAAELAAIQAATGATGLTAAQTAASTGAATGGATTAATGGLTGSTAGGIAGTGLTAGQLASGAGTIAKVLGLGGGDSSGGGGLNLNSLASLFGGGLDWYNQNKASNDMLDYLKQRQAMTDNMYSAGSPEAKALWDEMSRKDAAAGRNSQYGPRSVDLAARIAKIKGDANTQMTTGLANVYANALNQKAAAPAGLMSALGQSGGVNNLAQTLSSILNMGSGSGISVDPTGRGNTGTLSDEQYTAARDLLRRIEHGGDIGQMGPEIDWSDPDTWNGGY